MFWIQHLCNIFRYVITIFCINCTVHEVVHCYEKNLNLRQQNMSMNLVYIWYIWPRNQTYTVASVPTDTGWVLIQITYFDRVTFCFRWILVEANQNFGNRKRDQSLKKQWHKTRDNICRQKNSLKFKKIRIYALFDVNIQEYKCLLIRVFGHLLLNFPEKFYSTA